MTKSLGVGAASAAASKATGGDNFEAAVSGISSGVAEFVTGNPKIANFFGTLGKTFGNIAKSIAKKIGTTTVKEGAKSECKAVQGGAAVLVDWNRIVVGGRRTGTVCLKCFVVAIGLIAFGTMFMAVKYGWHEFWAATTHKELVQAGVALVAAPNGCLIILLIDIVIDLLVRKK